MLTSVLRLLQKIWKRIDPKTPENMLRDALEKEGKFSVWPVNPRVAFYQMGMIWRITLSQSNVGPNEPKREFIENVRKLGRITVTVNTIAKRFGLKSIIYGPDLVDGKALVVYCGFKTELFEALKGKLGDNLWDEGMAETCLDSDQECVALCAKGVSFVTRPAQTADAHKL